MINNINLLPRRGLNQLKTQLPDMSHSHSCHNMDTIGICLYESLTTLLHTCIFMPPPLYPPLHFPPTLPIRGSSLRNKLACLQRASFSGITFLSGQKDHVGQSDCLTRHCGGGGGSAIETDFTFSSRKYLPNSACNGLE